MRGQLEAIGKQVAQHPLKLCARHLRGSARLDVEPVGIVAS
jgi:hypothetical protein